MLSKVRISEIQSLKLRKFRKKQKLFIAEGPKLVGELLNSKFILHSLYFVDRRKVNIPFEKCLDDQLFSITEKELSRISLLKTPNQVLALFHMDQTPNLTPQNISDLVIILDEIKDPGNLGTIVRTADWFGIKNIVCSENCVDIYNPKVVQATMGSIARVNVSYADLKCFISDIPPEIDVFGAMADGKNMYDMELPSKVVLIIGSESHGISEELIPFLTERISIPPFASDFVLHAESLNASIATAIICSEFRRQIKYR